MSIFSKRPSWAVTGVFMLTVASLAVPAACQASPSVNFAYALANADTDFYGLSSQEKPDMTVYCATKFDAKDLDPYAGNQISHLTVYSPTDNVYNPQTDIELFVYEDDLSGDPLYTQKAKVSEQQKAANVIRLTTPVGIVKGKSYYVGYRLRVPCMPFYYMPVDLNAASPERCISKITYNDDGSYPSEWDRIGKGYGNLCLGLTITGDNMPDNWAVINSAKFPPYLAPSAKGGYEITVENHGISPVSSLSVATTLPDGRVVESDAVLAAPIAASSVGKATVSGLSFDHDGYYALSAVITKVNGKPARENAAATGAVMVYPDLFRRRPVMEEAGGAWCKWCPSGLVMLDNIHKDFPDDFCCISVHQGDKMDLPAYYPFLVKYFTSFPASIVNRAVEYCPAIGHSEEYTRNVMREIYDYYTSYPAPADVSFSFVPTPDGKKIRISSEVEFALDLERQYMLSFVLTEDNVGPYNQLNGYSGGDSVMGGWEEADTDVSTLYDDVAREILGFPGIEGSLPASVEKGKKYGYSCELSLSRVKGSDWRVIALVTDAETGEIVNSAQVLSDTYRSVGCTVADDVSVRVDGNVLTVEGASQVAVYSMNGQLVSTASVSRLPKGIYVVRADSRSRKIVIK